MKWHNSTKVVIYEFSRELDSPFIIAIAYIGLFPALISPITSCVARE